MHQINFKYCWVFIDVYSVNMTCGTATFLENVAVKTSSSSVTYDYLVTAALPSTTSSLSQVWELTLKGTVSPSGGQYEIDVSNVDCTVSDISIAFYSPLEWDGTVNFFNRQFSAKRYISLIALTPTVLVLGVKVPSCIRQGHSKTVYPFYLTLTVQSGPNNSSLEWSYTLTEEDHAFLRLHPLFETYIKIYSDIIPTAPPAVVPYIEFIDLTTSKVYTGPFNYSSYYPGRDYSQQLLSGGDGDQYASYWVIDSTIYTVISGIPSSIPNPFKTLRYYAKNIQVINYTNLLFTTSFSGIGPEPRVNKSVICDDPSIQYSVNGVAVPNPFLSKNLTPNCFTGSITNTPYPFQTFPSTPIMLPSFPNPNTRNKVNVYFPSADIVAMGFLGEGNPTPEGCITGYLLAVPDCTECPNFPTVFPFGIMRITIPDSYLSNASYCCESSACTSEKFDVYYSSVSSMQEYCYGGDSGKDCLPFWSVNTRLLVQGGIDFEIDGQKYAYVFWAPQEQVYAYLGGSKPSTPPIITWGNKKGYLLGAPSWAFYFRYKLENKDWPGNTARLLPCAPTIQDLQPITNELMGPTNVNWCPQLYGDNSITSLQSILDNSVTNIGPVNNLTETSWPPTS